MVAVKGIYDGKKIKILESLPKAMSRRKSIPVVVTFLEEEKLPSSTLRAIREMLTGKTRNLDEVLSEL